MNERFQGSHFAFRRTFPALVFMNISIVLISVLQKIALEIRTSFFLNKKMNDVSVEVRGLSGKF